MLVPLRGSWRLCWPRLEGFCLCSSERVLEAMLTSFRGSWRLCWSLLKGLGGYLEALLVPLLESLGGYVGL